MALQLNEHQRGCVDAVMAKMEEYGARRYQQVRRLNPRVEAVWDEIAWQQKTRLRASLAGDKSFGPVRFQVAELLLGDDQRKIRELFSKKSQASLLGEIVEEKEGEGHRTHGALEIHDMRTLFRTIDPSLESITNLMQTFIWWDLKDGADLARFDRKAASLAELQKGNLPEETARRIMQFKETDKKPSVEDALLFELEQASVCLESFRLSRSEELGHQLIVAREQGQMENPDMLIQGLAGQLNLLKNLEGGGAIDDSVRQQIGNAMKVAPDQVTAEKAAPFVRNLISQNKNRLKSALNGQVTGDFYDYKARQLQQLQKRFDELKGDREIKKVPAEAAAG